MAARQTQKLKPFDVDALWALARIGDASLSPDGAQAVASVTRHSMDENSARSSLYLFSTLGGEPRRLTEAGDKDGAPQWSPTGEQIAFIAKRSQDGRSDDEPQLYLIAPDGGEARRAAQLPTGVEAFKWCPDGRHIAFVAWVWPERRGAEQAQALKDFKARKESAYVTSEGLYRWWDHNLPMGRVAHLHLLDTATGQVRDLFEGTPLELSRTEPDANCFDISPDGKRIVFAFDPHAEKRHDHDFALAEIELKSGKVRTLLRDKGWHFSAPRYSHSGSHLALLAQHRAARHTMPNQLAILDQRGHWAVFSENWDREVAAPLRWADDDLSVLFAAEDIGRRHLWQLHLADCEVEILCEGGHIGSFDVAAGFCVINHDSVAFPPRLSVLSPDGPLRMEAINDDLLNRHAWGKAEEVWLDGAQDDAVQTWLIYPPDFNPKKKYPVMHVIHGGPHTAFGDSWHWRWNHQVFASPSPLGTAAAPRGGAAGLGSGPAAGHAAQGYVVACVNYHGSSSFGYAFLDSITHRWGELELQDIEAATDWLIKQPWVDKKRISATGGSYGGYMVAWMNGHCEPGRYQAYVCHAGCFDWQAMYADDAYNWHAKELGARYWQDPARIAAQSPSAHIARARTPTLVVHGAMDYRVPDAQGLAYYNTLKSLDVPARLVWFPDENHWVLKPRNSKLWYGEFFAWLDQHGHGRKR